MDMVVRVPGSCGELVQGVINGTPFLVTFPINIYTEVCVSDKIKGIQGLDTKAVKAMRMMLDKLEVREFPWGIRLISSLPQGKGMASSSADIAAVVYAVARAFGKEVEPLTIMEIATAIEPTDGIFVQGMAVMNQIAGEIHARYDRVPCLPVSVFDTGGTVDTLEFHKRQAVENKEINQLAYENLTVRLAKAMELNDDDLETELGQLATESAILNQQLLAKSHYDELYAEAMKLGALGIVVAHSGTVMGVIWSSRLTQLEHINKTHILGAIFQDRLIPLGVARLISGGIELNID